jgi:hypothetical protein
MLWVDLSAIVLPNCGARHKRWWPADYSHSSVARIPPSLNSERMSQGRQVLGEPPFADFDVYEPLSKRCAQGSGRIHLSENIALSALTWEPSSRSCANSLRP